MSSYETFVNSDRKNNFFFTNLTPGICHMTIAFREKNLYILLAYDNICQKQNTESVYLISKYNYVPFSEIGIFQNFSLPQQKQGAVNLPSPSHAQTPP